LYQNYKILKLQHTSIVHAQKYDPWGKGYSPLKLLPWLRHYINVYDVNISGKSKLTKPAIGHIVLEILKDLELNLKSYVEVGIDGCSVMTSKILVS
jgi:hypothetical protein